MKTLLLSLILMSENSFGAGALETAQRLYDSGQYFQSARYAFSSTEEGVSAGEAYSWITLSLMRAGMPQSASYFFIRTLQSGQKAAIRRVLVHTQALMRVIGPDILKRYLIRHTKYEDYDEINQSAYLYALGKQALLQGDEKYAIGYLKAISSGSTLAPYALELSGVAYAIIGQVETAIYQFGRCVSQSRGILSSASAGVTGDWMRLERSQADDLKNRCQAGIARTLYQAGRFEEAERAYDRIPKESLVWPDILFEQAWNGFARSEYNRTLGKLVTYKSPALQFVFNTEVDVLRAQAYLLLCLYDDANNVINEFNKQYSGVGEQVKRFVESKASNLSAFYDEGKTASTGSLYGRSDIHRVMNRFVRSPYFQTLVASEKSVENELAFMRQMDTASSGGTGFPGFLKQVLGSRVKQIELLGGAFVKNSLMDYHRVLLSDFDKMSFIKLEMLSRAKAKLAQNSSSVGERTRGVRMPVRRDDQYRWGFNGEFWNDELGDYVFGLESQCQGT
ncbi:MAG: hypothetical protein KA715_08590 [Xanthomonadaceae bacterium]|nr:hypothetical protein [Xanthomonadaceae bacterium]